MTKRQVEELVAEIQLYLETVETFRAQGREPCWRAEWPEVAAAAGPVRVRARKRGSSKPREGG